MTYEEVHRSVGARVMYTFPGAAGRPGVIERVQVLPTVLFDDGTRKQIAPNRLALIEGSPPPERETLF